MAFWRRWTLVALLMAWPALRPSAAIAADEQHAFGAAVQNWKAGFYELAEKGFKEFIQTYTNSANLPEAVLLLAEAQIEQTNYTAAIELLASRQNLATNWADQYQFWRAEAQFRKGDYLAAADAFAKLVKDFPTSTRRLEAVIGEATARAQLADWRSVAALLQQTNGVFQTAALANPGDKHVVQGYLLVAEASLAQQDRDAAERALQPLAKLQLPPGPAWQWNYLQGRIRLAKGQNEEALKSATNMLEKAAETKQPSLRADSFAFEAEIFERLGRLGEAVAAYTNNLATATPPGRQRQALLKITELSLARNEVASAMQTLGQFLRQYPTGPAADLGWLTLGELQLRQYVAGLSTNAPSVTTNPPASTNLLAQAQASFETLAKDFAKSPFFGKGQLDLGWCFWLANKLPECEKAFQAAVQGLPPSVDQAIAYFKLADTQLQLKNFTNALANYNVVIDKFSSLPEVKTNLFPPALYQAARAALAAGQPNAATNAMTKLVTEYPKDFHTERAVLLAGQQVSQQGNPAAAREIFAALVAAAPDASLLPQVRLAVARTYEDEEKWPEAIGQYDGWLSVYTNNEARPAASYYQARANFFAGRLTNAFTLFTNFVANFPTDTFAPLAQWWAADYYYQIPDYGKAEIGYKLLFQKWPASDLADRARLMAGHCAFNRQGWDSAIDLFTNLTSNPGGDLWAEAVSAYGDTLMARASSNKVADYWEAIRVFNVLCESKTTNSQTTLAWGQLASCYLQWALASGQPDALTNAINAFQKVIEAPPADATARSIAKVGMGVVREAQARSRTAVAEQQALLKLALEDYLDVFNGKDLRANEEPDLFWTQKAGLNAGNLAEKLEWWPQAVNVYERLKELLPAFSGKFDDHIRKAQEHQPTAKLN